jgi:hypothetical protein
MALSGAGGLLVAPLPAGAADASLYQIRLSDKDGFSPGVVDVRVGDYLAFKLETQSPASSTAHSVTWDDQSTCPSDAGDVPCWPELRFNDAEQKCMVRNYTLPNTRCILVKIAGSFRYHDRLSLEAGGPDFQGLVNVVGPSTTTTTAAPTTTTTAAPTTTTRPATTTSLPSTTTTTAATTIRPFLIPDQSSTTVTTALPAGAAAGSNTKGSASPAPKDKGKSKGASPATPTTAAPAPPGPLPLEPVFDPASLTPGPITLPDTVNPADSDDESYLDTAVMSLLSPEKAADEEGNSLMLGVLGAAGLLLLGGGAWHWYHRASRYFPA